MRIAIFPARGGSKRVPGKNIRKFFGKPMILWPLEVAIKSKLFDYILVSTDDPEIAQIVENMGAKAPFIRPSNISDDYSGTGEVVIHAIHWYMEHYPNHQIDSVCCIYPTAPFLLINDLLEAVSILSSNNWEYVFSAAEYKSPIFRAFGIQNNGGARMIFPEYLNYRSQDLPHAFHDAAQFYLARPLTWINNMPIFTPNSYPLRIPHWRVQDIDTEDDWLRAEMLAKYIFQETSNLK